MITKLRIYVDRYCIACNEIDSLLSESTMEPVNMEVEVSKMEVTPLT